VLGETNSATKLPLLKSSLTTGGEMGSHKQHVSKEFHIHVMFKSASVFADNIPMSDGDNLFNVYNDN